MTTPTFLEQQDAYTRYNVLGSKSFLRKQMQNLLVVREEELALAGSDASPAMDQQLLGYEMGLQDLYILLFNEDLPEKRMPATLELAS